MSNRMRDSSNAFASGHNQNCGNFITSTPTTRVVAPPGGSSSFSLGWSDTPTPRRGDRGKATSIRDDISTVSYESRSDAYDTQSRASSNAYSRSSCTDASRSRQRPVDPERSQMPCINEDSMSVSDSAYHHSRRSLGASRSFCRSSEAGSQATSVRSSRNSRRDFETSSDAPSQRSDQSNREARFRPNPRVSSNAYACNNNQNCGNVLTDVPSTRVIAPPGGKSSVRLGDCRREVADVERKAGMCGRREREEIEGSRPRVRRPEVRVNAPPGGMTSISNDMTVEQARQMEGRKLFPDAGQNTTNRDLRFEEELRYFKTDSEALGKQHIRAMNTRASQRDCENQRFHLDADQKVARVPGKAQLKKDAPTRGALPRSSESTSTYAPSDCDDLPLGAEWSSWGDSECGTAY